MSAQPDFSSRSPNRRRESRRHSYEAAQVGRGANSGSIATTAGAHATVTAAIVAQLDAGPGA